MTQEATRAPTREAPAQAGTGPGPPPGRARIAAAVAALRGSEAWRAAWRAFAWSRLAIAAVAVFAALSAGQVAADDVSRFDVPAVTAPIGGFGEVALSPLARWDAVWYLSVANGGYQSADSPRHAFFPLYPLLARGVGELGGGGAGAVLIAAYLVALAAFLAALVLLHRLTEIELGRRAAWPALLLLCTFPASLYFGAPYPESLFLLCSVGAFYAARTGHWAWAGIAGAAASGTRSAGVLLLAPLLYMYLYGPRPRPRGAVPRPAGAGRLAPVRAALRPRFPIRTDVLWLALAPAGLVAYAAYLGIAYGDPLSFSHVQEFWSRSFAGPFVGVWDGAVAAFDGLRQIGGGTRAPVYFEQAAGDPLRVAAQNVMLFGFLCFATAAVAGVVRRLPFAYGLYVLTALALPLSYPVAAQPLMSLPRFVAVLFPIFMWLGAFCAERRLTERVAIASAVALGLFVSQFATWHWVA